MRSRNYHIIVPLLLYLSLLLTTRSIAESVLLADTVKQKKKIVPGLLDYCMLEGIGAIATGYLGMRFPTWIYWYRFCPRHPHFEWPEYCGCGGGATQFITECILMAVGTTIVGNLLKQGGSLGTALMGASLGWAFIGYAPFPWGFFWPSIWVPFIGSALLYLGNPAIGAVIGYNFPMLTRNQPSIFVYPEELLAAIAYGLLGFYACVTLTPFWYPKYLSPKTYPWMHFFPYTIGSTFGTTTMGHTLHRRGSPRNALIGAGLGAFLVYMMMGEFNMWQSEHYQIAYTRVAVTLLLPGLGAVIGYNIGGGCRKSSPKFSNVLTLSIKAIEEEAFPEIRLNLIDIRF